MPWARGEQCLVGAGGIPAVLGSLPLCPVETRAGSLDAGRGKEHTRVAEGDQIFLPSCKENKQCIFICSGTKMTFLYTAIRQYPLHCTVSFE